MRSRGSIRCLAIEGPLAIGPPPNPAVLEPAGRARGGAERGQGARERVRARDSAGSGWVARRGLVVTAAHVVAGEDSTTVQAPGGLSLDAEAVAFDSRNDVAVLRVAGLEARPLRIVAPRPGTPVALLGYPRNGAFTVASRAGSARPRRSSTDDAYGRGPVVRLITSLRGADRPRRLRRAGGRRRTARSRRRCSRRGSAAPVAMASRRRSSGARLLASSAGSRPAPAHAEWSRARRPGSSCCPRERSGDEARG